MIGNKKPSYKGGFSVNLLLTWDILPLLVCTPLCFVRRSTRIQKTAHKDGFSVNSPLVRMKGLEPSRPEALAPKASVSTNSTTSACIGRHYCITSLNVCETLLVVRVRLCFFALVWHRVHRQGWQDEVLPGKTAHRLQSQCQSCSRYP